MTMMDLLPARTAENTIEAFEVAPEDVPAWVSDVQYPEYLPIRLHSLTWADDGDAIIFEAEIEWIVERSDIPRRPGLRPQLLAETFGQIRCPYRDGLRLPTAPTGSPQDDVRYVRSDRVLWYGPFSSLWLGGGER